MARTHAAGRPRYRLRRVALTDLELLGKHRAGMWRDIGGRSERAIAGHLPAYRRWLRTAFARRRVTGFVAEDADGAPVASGLVWFQDAQPRPGELAPQAPYILSMYTEPAHRGHGLATQIVRALIALCRSRGYRRVTLHASEAGRPVYARLGFVPTREMRRFLSARTRSATRAPAVRRSR